MRSRIKREQDKSYSYICGCTLENKQITLFDSLFDYNSNFRYRRIYNVIVCDRLEIKREENYVQFCLNYRLAELLHIAYINPSYARYRIKDLPIMSLDYFITANPILIKVQILRTWCKQGNFILYSESKYKEIIANSSIDLLYESYLSNLDSIVEKISSVLSDKLAIYSSDIVSNKVKKAIKLYANLFIIMEICINLNHTKCGSSYFLDKYETDSISMKLDDISFSEEVKELIRDVIEQSTKIFEKIKIINTKPKGYYEQFSSSEYTYGCIERFISTRPYEKFLLMDQEILDAYTDLELFKNLLGEIKNKECLK